MQQRADPRPAGSGHQVPRHHRWAGLFSFSHRPGTLSSALTCPATLLLLRTGISSLIRQLRKSHLSFMEHLESSLSLETFRVVPHNSLHSLSLL